MIDRELLELAAKAVSLNIKGYRVDLDDNFTHFVVGKRGTREKTNWNPLTDDGDALRLAVKLGFDIRPTANISTIYVWSEVLDKWVGEFYGSSCDPYAATRRAIVRAAAEIGRSMK